MLKFNRIWIRSEKKFNRLKGSKEKILQCSTYYKFYTASLGETQSTGTGIPDFSSFSFLECLATN